MGVGDGGGGGRGWRTGEEGRKGSEMYFQNNFPFSFIEPVSPKGFILSISHFISFRERSIFEKREKFFFFLWDMLDQRGTWVYNRHG